MIKKQQKWIALFVALTFIWLMQLSTMPAAAAGTTEKASLASAEQGPDYYEAVNHKAAPAKKKSMLPIILIGVGILGVTAAVLFLVVLKTNYDITGTWVIFYDSGNDDTYTFVGDKKSGTYTTIVDLAKGIYAVDGKSITITWTGWTGGMHYVLYSWVLTGKFDSKTTASGTYTGADWMGGFYGTWTAVKK